MFNLKKSLVVFLAAFMLLFPFAVFTPAYGATSLTVNVRTSLNVRSAGDMSAPVIGKLTNGTQVTIIDSINGWDEIIYNGQAGWVADQYLISAEDAADKLQMLADISKQQIGTKYIYGGNSPTGFDCSGLTMYTYQQVGISLPHSAAAQATKGCEISDKSDLRTGDLLCFRTNKATKNITHVGIYLDDNMFISANSSIGSVQEESLDSKYWSNAYVTARRLLN